ncbi:cupin domain-containing protein [Salinibacter ruber]|uniref:cupin domain-containing protein n=1 Tax=Salinibacter ruber TaxID=146919 RepID=UPI00216A9214|nr:cupin domain-containing protein [Salinibacter ruber]MCS4200294.1 oxalate decarboxylase/phosphoglucose isomerase-like protein (cupin superfamily) [Salinibacter ruber]
MARKRRPLSPDEKQRLDALLDAVMDTTVHHYGAEPRSTVRYDKREEMYGGSGTTYLLQMFEDGELVNNRIGAYMVLPTRGDSAGFHTHGDRNEQELYAVMRGEGTYLEKDHAEAEARSVPIEEGTITTVRGNALHAVRNTGPEPLIIFVITTFEPGKPHSRDQEQHGPGQS